MNILKLFFALFTIIPSISVFGQTEAPILFRINNDIVVTKSEFEYAYKKDTSKAKNNSENIDKFLESYINFKLSVEEAKQQGLDKDKEFISEYSIYLEQLEKPYLTDSITPETLSKKLYERLKENIEISQLLIRLPSGYILPKDTVNAYETVLKIRNSIDKGTNSSFEELVAKFSEDTIFKNSITPGYMGWRTAFSTRYPFEESIYNLSTNEISNPVRTNEGYHLIKVLNKRPDPGQVNISHIVLLFPNTNPTQQEKDSVYNVAQQVYNKLKAGEEFNALCFEYSDDRETANKGGNLGWFNVNRPAPSSFEKLWYDLKNPGDLTLPTETYYGYHIFKLIAKTPLFPWDMLKESLIDAIDKSDRKDVLIERQIELLSTEYPYTIQKDTYTILQNTANEYLLSDTTYFNTIYSIYDKSILKVSNNVYTVKDFIFYLEKNPNNDYKLSTDILKYKFNEFILDRIIETKRLDLPYKYPEFHYLTQEFHDGILYFNIMNENVWQKAQSDKTALEKLFRMDYPKYKWKKPKYKGYIIHARNKNIIEEVKKIIVKSVNEENLSHILVSTLNNDSTRNVIVEKGLWAEGENDYIDRLVYNIDTPREMVGYPEIITEGKLITEPENLNDTLGAVTVDYQKIIEEQWYNALRKKYTIQINEDVLESLKQKI